MQVIEEIKKKIAGLPRKKMDNKEREFIQRYLGTQKTILGVNTGNLVKTAKDVVRHDNFKTDELIKLLDELLLGDNIEEHITGGKFFTFLKPDDRAKIPFSHLRKWLESSRGWVEVDVICQSAYIGIEVLKRWEAWEKSMREFAGSDIISVRRASLVLQRKPVGEIMDKKLRRLAFETVDKLKQEKEILITKAVSWLLRALTVQNKEEVRDYILKNESTLPRIAFRETMRKIETGKK